MTKSVWNAAFFHSARVISSRSTSLPEPPSKTSLVPPALSATRNTSMSWPLLPLSVSPPAPPSRVSAPAPPFSLSEPRPPDIKLSPDRPFRMSAPEVPFTILAMMPLQFPPAVPFSAQRYKFISPTCNSRTTRHG